MAIVGASAPSPTTSAAVGVLAPRLSTPGAEVNVDCESVTGGTDRDQRYRDHLAHGADGEALYMGVATISSRAEVSARSGAA